jgi:tryptophan 2,3-dioxygenase
MTTYAEFLRLPTLLDSVAPSTPPTNRRVHSAEHFFLVAHQTSELWLKQVLMDVNEATVALGLPDRDLPQASSYVDRAASVLELVASHVAVFRRLTPGDFADFRPVFGDASGAQSEQFHRLQSELGLYGHPSHLFAEFTSAVAERSTTLVEVYRQAPHSGELYHLAESLANLSQAAWHWQLDHVDIVTRVIGRVPGTGGTTGADYLSGRLAAPFPELWEARSLLHRTNGGTTCPHDASQR